MRHISLRSITKARRNPNRTENLIPKIIWITIFSEEINMLMEGKSLEEIMDYMDKTAEETRKDPFHLGKTDAGSTDNGSAGSGENK